jgi:hypothetical protein
MTDYILVKHLKTDTFFENHTSTYVQNEIIKICNDLIQENIITKIKYARFFSVLIDESQDVSRLKQM